MTRRLSVTLTLSLVSALLSACPPPTGADAGAPADGGQADDDVVIPDTTVILDEDAVGLLRQASPDLSTLTFTDTDGRLAGIDIGDVLVAPATADLPYGMLRRVMDVARDGDTLTATTAPAALSEAIERGALDETFELDPTTAIGERDLIVDPIEGGFFFGYDDIELFDADGDPATTDDRVSLDGSFAFRPLVRFRIAFDGFELETLVFEIGADQEASVRVTAGREATFTSAC
jgi:hypothetical protein